MLGNLHCFLLRFLSVEDLYAYEESRQRKRPPVQSNATERATKRHKQDTSANCKNLAMAYICRPPPKVAAVQNVFYTLQFKVMQPYMLGIRRI